MDKLPHITMVIDTVRYRNNLLEEAVECFLRQTYPNKHLLIHNAHPDPVYFEKYHSNIEIINLRNCWASFAQKIFFSIAQVKTELWCGLDDDDIVPSWHLGTMVKRYLDAPCSGKPKLVGHRKAMSLENGKLRIRKKSWLGFCWEMPNADDFEELRLLLENHKGRHANFDTVLLGSSVWDRTIYDFPTRPSFVRRLHSDKIHVSQGEYGAENELKRIHEINKQASLIRHGEPLHPHWDMDYEEQVEEFLVKIEQNGFNYDQWL